MDALQEDEDCAEGVPVLRQASGPGTQRRALEKLPAKTLRKADWPAYLKALEETKNPKSALIAIGKQSYSLISLRKDREGRRREQKILGYLPRQAKPHEYLYLLRKLYGDWAEALRRIGSRSDALLEWRENGRFRRREQEIYDQFKSKMDAENIRVALGAGAKTRDPQHLRWVLAHTDPDKWGDKKTVEHNVNVKVSQAELDSEILELLGES